MDIPLLSLTASDNEGQFKNHIKIQQPHTQAAECLFHLNISTCVSKETWGRGGSPKQDVGFFLFLWDVEDFTYWAVTFPKLVIYLSRIRWQPLSSPWTWWSFDSAVVMQSLCITEDFERFYALGQHRLGVLQIWYEVTFSTQIHTATGHHTPSCTNSNTH